MVPRMSTSGLAVVLMLNGLASTAQSQTVISFQQAISMAVEASPKRELAQSDVDIAGLKRSQALAGLGPKLRADYSNVRFDKPVVVPFGAEAFSIRPDQFQEGSLTLSQPITGLYAAYEQAGMAKVEQDSSALSLDLIRTEAAFEAAQAYRRAQQADELLRIAEASIGSTEGQARDAESMMNSGRLIRSDFLKITIARSEAKAQLAKALSTRKKAHEWLRYALGLPVGQELAIEPTNASLQPKEVATPALESAVQSASQTRLELRKAELEVEQSAYKQRLARFRYAPDVNVFVKWEKIFSELPFGNPESTRSYGVTASWELWDNGSRRFANKTVVAETHKAEISLKEAKDHLRLEIQSLLADADAAKEALVSAQTNVAQAEEAYRLDKARFGSGLVTATDLLIAEAGQTRARGALVTANTDLEILQLAIQKATGDNRPK